MKNAITIQELASRLSGKAWEKGDLKRVYLEMGHNTKKMSTKCYVYEKDGAWKVSVNIDCPSQPAQWIDSQEEELRDRIEEELRIALVETFYYIEVHGKPVDEYGKTVDSVSELYLGQDLFTSEKDAVRLKEKREIEGTVKAIDRSDYDAIVDADRKARAAKREEERKNQPVVPERKPAPAPVAMPVEVDMTAFEVGSKWNHPKFGIGEVLSVEGGNVTLSFATEGVKRLLAKFAPLTPAV